MSRWLACAAVAATAVGCNSRAALLHPAGTAPPAAAVSKIRFTDVSDEAGVRFNQWHGGSGRHYLIETIPGGCAFLDYDGDGLLDVFLTQCQPLPGTPAGSPRHPILYRNTGRGTFEDVTQQAGLEDEYYGIAAAAGDVDNDGDPDLYVSAYGRGKLYRNDGGVFTDISDRAGLDVPGLPASAAFLDYDGDGRLDLFVCGYARYSPETDRLCKDEAGRPFYCGPLLYDPTVSNLFRNLGGGAFRNTSAAAGIHSAKGYGMGVVCTDVTGDGRVDIFVANDGSPNHLWVNKGNGKFREEAVPLGLSHAQSGLVRAGMGVDCDDYDNDTLLDFVVTNFENEPISLFRGDAGGVFRDESYPSGVGAPSLPYVQWGCRFVDLDTDGWKDVFVVGGHVDDRVSERRPGTTYSHPCQVYRNEGAGQFTEASRLCGPFFSQELNARGAAFGDYDNDGDTDVLIASNNGRAVLLRNDSPPRGWVRLDLRGEGCNRDGIGAVVRVTTNGLPPQTQPVRSGGSYGAAHDRRLLFGIGDAAEAEIHVRWPCGATQASGALVRTTRVVRESGCQRRCSR